jgi:NADPH:quinone reductase-like Zn-dependent oxidoreductase
MHALRIHEHGGPEVLRWEEIPRPEPGPGQVLLRVKAASLNHLDLWVRRGVAGHKFPLPITPGCDFAGVVEAAGEGVKGWKSGDEAAVAPGFSCGACIECGTGNDHLCRGYGIYGETCDGGCAGFALAAASNLLPRPKNLSWEETASVPLAFLTAWQMLVGRAKIQPGETVLIHAAGSGVSSAAVQIAKLHGARVVATAGSVEKCRKALEILGADESLDYTRVDWVKEVRAITGRRGADVVLDHVGAATFERSLMCLTKGGRLVTCGASSGYEIKFNAALVFFKSVSVLGSTMGPRGLFGEIFRHLGEGRLRPVVDRVLPLTLAGARKGHEALEAREVFGKVALSLAG